MAIRLKPDSFKPAKEALRGLNKQNISYVNPFDPKTNKRNEIETNRLKKYLEED